MAGLNYIDNRVEPWYLAWHWWTRDLVKTVEDKIDTQDHKTSSILRDIQVDTANGKLASTVNDIKKWQLELKKATDQNSVDLITQQIEALEDTKSKLDTQLKVLNKIKTNP